MDRPANLLVVHTDQQSCSWVGAYGCARVDHVLSTVDSQQTILALVSILSSG